MRAGSRGKRNHRRGLLQEVHFGNANQEDGLFPFVCTATGDPLGNASLLNRGGIKRFIGAGKEVQATQCVCNFFFLSTILYRDNWM